MKIIIDSLEAEKQPVIASALKANNEIEIKRLECGDYFCYPVLIEHKTLPNFVGDVNSGHIFQQCQDMIYSRSQNFDLKLFILISGNIADIFKLQHASPAEPIIAAWASLNRQGVPTIFIGNQWFFIKGMQYIFQKYNDGKIREYNPVRKPITMQHEILTNFCSIPNIGEKTAWKLSEKFKTPKSLYNATIQELQEVEGIGKKTAQDMYNFFNGAK